MKIFSVENYDKSELDIKIKSNKQYMHEVLSCEQAEKERPDIYINSDWHYVIGRDEVKFVFVDFESIPLYGNNERICDYLFEISILINKKLYVVQVSQEEIYTEKWLKGIKSEELLIITRGKYQKLISAIDPRKSEKIWFEKIGIHEVEKKYYYVASNCAITSEGINRQIKALQDGFNLQFRENIGERECARKFIKYNLLDMRVFYPIHCISILAVIGYFMQKNNISSGVVLWLDGEVASGKTELAITLGDIFNRGGKYIDMKKNLYLTKIKTQEIEQKLLEYKNAVLIIDDVKKEETTRNKENGKNVTDIVVRSIYLGKLGHSQNDTVNATAIITGEFFKEQVSTVSRILYMNVGKFLQGKKHSDSLKTLQTDKTYFADFMRYFICWLLRKAEENALDFNDIMQSVSATIERQPITGEISPRTNEIYRNFLICTQVVYTYLNEIFLENDKELIIHFYHECKNVIGKSVKETWLKCTGNRPVFTIAFDYIMKKLKIKDCRYGQSFLQAKRLSVDLDIALSDINYRGKSLNDDILRPEKVWLLRYTKDYAGMIVNFGKEDILLLDINVVCEKMREYIVENKSEWNVPYYPSDFTNDKILTGLMSSQSIFVHKRDDGTFDRVFRYPLMEQVENTDEYTLADEKGAQMVKVNLNRGNVIEGLENVVIDDVEEWVKVRENLQDGARFNEIVDKIDRSIEIMNKFLDLK